MILRLFVPVLISVGLSETAQLAPELAVQAAGGGSASTEVGGRLGTLFRSSMVFAGPDRRQRFLGARLRFLVALSGRVRGIG
jgi:hypothetical protein